MQDVIKIILLSLGSVIALLLLAKIMGYRQLSEMSMFDYILSITIGSIAAEMATSLEDNFVNPLVAMIVYALVSWILSVLCTKTILFRRIIIGKPLVLLNNNKLYENNLRKAKLDINEFLEQCRVSGYFDISQLQSAVLETNGKISFLPKANYRPTTPEDFKQKPEPSSLCANVIIDGNIMHRNLKACGKDENWLYNELKANNIVSVELILLATCDTNNTFTYYEKQGDNLPHEYFT